MPRGDYKTETRGSKPTGEIPLTWMAFGREMISNGGNATAAYRKAFPKCKGEEDYVRWCAYKLKKKLYESHWFQEILDEAGVTRERLSKKIAELLEAKKKSFIVKNGEIVERESEDNQTQIAATKLALEAHRVLVQRTESQVSVTGIPTSFTGWLRKETEEQTNGNANADASADPADPADPAGAE